MESFSRIICDYCVLNVLCYWCCFFCNVQNFLYHATYIPSYLDSKHFCFLFSITFLLVVNFGCHYSGFIQPHFMVVNITEYNFIFSAYCSMLNSYSYPFCHSPVFLVCLGCSIVFLRRIFHYNFFFVCLFVVLVLLCIYLISFSFISVPFNSYVICAIQLCVCVYVFFGGRCVKNACVCYFVCFVVFSLVLCNSRIVWILALIFYYRNVDVEQHTIGRMHTIKMAGIDSNAEKTQKPTQKSWQNAYKQEIFWYFFHFLVICSS